MPTRSRAKQAIERLAEYRRLAGRPIMMEVVADFDDATMQSLDVLRSLRDLDCVLTLGSHRSKVEAVNGGRVTDWDILVLTSDDMAPVVDGWAVRIEQEMQRHFPMLDGALHFTDGIQGERLYTLPILGRRLHEQFGHVYDPSYQSLWCDNEQTDVLRSMGRLAYIPTCIIEHRHYVFGKAANDALYKRNDSFNEKDKALYKARAARKFDSPTMKLSILIAALPQRVGMLHRLLDHIWTQALKHPREVEVVVDSSGDSTGAKRQRLLGKARGEFVAFVDDDDWVSHDYVDRILAALRKTPNADCVEFHVAMLMSGKTFRGHCSMKYDDWSTVGSLYVRCPNHLSPVRRALAVKAGFPDQTVSEDHVYSMRLRPMLKVEAPMSGAPLYFYFPNGAP